MNTHDKKESIKRVAEGRLMKAVMHMLQNPEDERIPIRMAGDEGVRKDFLSGLHLALNHKEAWEASKASRQQVEQMNPGEVMPERVIKGAVSKELDYMLREVILDHGAETAMEVAGLMPEVMAEMLPGIYERAVDKVKWDRTMLDMLDEQSRNIVIHGKWADMTGLQKKIAMNACRQSLSSYTEELKFLRVTEDGEDSIKISGSYKMFNKEFTVRKLLMMLKRLPGCVVDYTAEDGVNYHGMTYTKISISITVPKSTLFTEHHESLEEIDWKSKTPAKKRQIAAREMVIALAERSMLRGGDWLCPFLDPKSVKVETFPGSETATIRVVEGETMNYKGSKYKGNYRAWYVQDDCTVELTDTEWVIEVSLDRLDSFIDELRWQ